MWHDPTPLGAVSMWIHRQCMDIDTMMAAVQVFWQSNGMYGMGWPGCIYMLKLNPVM